MARQAGAVLGILFFAHAAGAQFTQQGSKLVGTGAVGPTTWQGNSVAISADGNTAIVGGPGDSSDAGAAWVFTRSGQVWSQQGSKLVGTGAAGTAQQGWSVAISGDGNTAIVGGPNDDYDADNNSYAGAAWVFTRSGGVWSQQGSKLVGTDAVGAAQQGVSVAISADGNTAIVGGEGDDSFAGAAWVYTRTGGVWKQQGSKLVGWDAVGTAWQGWSVAISADGNTAIVGGYQDNFKAGAAWVYTRSGSVWSQQGTKLVGTGVLGASQQGYSVAISADGNTTIVGGDADNSNAGAAWVFARSGGVWSQQGSKLVGTGAVGGANQGNSVTISADGNTAAVGGSRDNSDVGAAWVFTRSGGVWSQQASKLVGSSGAGAQGTSVAISADGNTAIVGGPTDYWAGAAWVFVANACTSVSITSQPQSQSIASGQTATLSVTATGTGPLSYQWYQGSSGDNSQPVGTNANSLTTSALTATTSYWVRVSNACGHADSATATVSVSCTSPTITSQPQSQSIASGQTATLSVTATGITPLSYQWYQGSSGDSSQPVGSNANSFTTSALTATTSYWVRVSNACGHADSATATVSVSCASPTITSQPQSQTLASGQTATLSVTATGTAPLSYQWYQGASGDTSTLVGTNAGSFTTPALTATTSYWVRVSNSCGYADSATATVSIICTSPSITSQPLSQTIASGQTVTLSVTAAGTPPLSYQWYQGSSSDTSQPVGTIASSFTTPALTATTSYWVRVSNDCGHADSATATITVVSAPAYSIWVPVASHNSGKNNSQWRSDLGLLNTGTVTANVQIDFFGSSGVVSSTTTVPAGTQSILTDVVGQLPASGSGAIEVLSDQPLKVTARSYNQVPSDASCYAGGTQGQDYPAVVASDGLVAGQSAYLAGLAEDASYRTNIGLVNVGSGAAMVLVELFDGAGNKLAEYTVSLAAGQWAQETQPFLNLARQTAMDSGYAKITVQSGESGSGVFGFASVIDNITNDPTTVAMSDPAHVTIREYSAGISIAYEPWSITAGPDGAMWFTECCGNQIGRITTAGVVTEYSAGMSEFSSPLGITAGPDGALWFTDYSLARIGRITTAGVVTEYSEGISPGAGPVGITLGSDGALWFTETNPGRIGRITTGGVVTEYSAGIPADAWPGKITAGPDGALWFRDGIERIGRITVAGVVTEFPLGIGGGAQQPVGITAGQDGALWFPQYVGDTIGRMTTAGVVTDYSAGITPSAEPWDITAGPDGALWFTESDAQRIGRVTTAGAVTEYSAGVSPDSYPRDITTGPDGALWFTEGLGKRIGRVTGAGLVSPGSFSVWVPVASHTTGLNNSQWRSDVCLLNPGTMTANVQIDLFGMSKTISLPLWAGAQSVLTDVVGQPGTTGSGAIEILSDQPLNVTARTYNEVPSGASCDANGTQGQDYPAVVASDGLVAGQSAYLAGLVENNASYRSNIGLVNVGSGAATVLVELFNGAGTKFTDYTVNLNPGDWKQETKPFFYKAGQTAMDRGYAKITVQTGSGVFGFASVIDNRTNDPTTVSAQR